ncbi:MAG: PD-(D/E)XK nuclease family protein [Clostridia bacterium]|nr:PD-(D/E)XK nuclease family protein [Clostridia bacterium]
MPLTIIRSGLTYSPADEYLKEIKELSGAVRNRELILMVPDRFSYIAERSICRAVGGAGLGGVTVMTFRQLIRSLVDPGEALSNVGKQMLIGKITAGLFSEDCVFYASKDRPGFIESVLEVISDWKRFCVEPDKLKSEIENAEDGTPKRKLSALFDVYCEYNKIFEENGFFDESELLIKSARKIREEKRFRNAYIWIDGFTEFVPPEIEVISAFLSVGAEVKIYLPAAAMFTAIQGGIYEVPQRAVRLLEEMCGAGGYDLQLKQACFPKKMNKCISFFCDNYDNDNSYHGDLRGISLSHADDIYTEAEHAASRIIDLVSEKDYKFSDISVLCGNLKDYASCIEAVFERYKIPYFSDYKVPLSNHPVSILLMCVFEIVYKKSFPLTAVDRYLKTGYIISNQDDADRLSLFAAKRGLKGSMWLNEKYFKNAPDGFFNENTEKEGRPVRGSERLLELRRLVAEPLLKYYEKSKGRKTVKEHVAAFFDYLTETELFGKIQRRVEEFEKIGDENEASRLTHVWNVLINMFDQMVISLGNEKITRAAFGQYLKTGIEGSEISIIPTVTNGVSVSDTGHRSGSEVRALFILGATRDTVPPLRTEDGILTEDETELFDSLPKSSGKSRINQFKEFELLRGISDTLEELYISCSSVNANGDREEPSVLFDSLTERFPGLKINRYTGNDPFISAPEVMLHRLLIKLSSEEELSPYYKCIRDWFMSKEERINSFELLEEAEGYKELVGSIPRELSAELYKNLTEYSVSRIEKYFRCPFSYFLTYGLKLDDDEVYGMKNTDAGDIVHLAVAEFCRRVGEENCWDTITDIECDKLVSDIMSDYRKDFEEDPKILNILERLEKTVCRAAYMSVISIRKSKYSVLDNELPFDGFTLEGGGGRAVFRGIIDRLDIYDEDGIKNIRIVDYKTGSKKLQLENVLNGLDLQLVIYAMAASEQIGGGAEVAGFFYNSLKKNIVNAESPEAAEEKLAKDTQLSGLVFENKSGSEYDVKNGADMDCDLLSNFKSSFLPLKLKKNGRYDAYSGVLSHEGFSRLGAQVRELASSAAAGIENGDVRVYPYSKNANECVCNFCPYTSVCMYDMCKGAEVNNGSEGKKLSRELN